MTSISQKTFPSLYAPKQSRVVCERAGGQHEAVLYISTVILANDVVMCCFYIVVPSGEKILDHFMGRLCTIQKIVLIIVLIINTIKTICVQKISSIISSWLLFFSHYIQASKLIWQLLLINLLQHRKAYGLIDWVKRHNTTSRIIRIPQTLCIKCLCLVSFCYSIYQTICFPL